MLFELHSFAFIWARLCCLCKPCHGNKNTLRTLGREIPLVFTYASITFIHTPQMHAQAISHVQFIHNIPALRAAKKKMKSRKHDSALWNLLDRAFTVLLPMHLFPTSFSPLSEQHGTPTPVPEIKAYTQIYACVLKSKAFLFPFAPPSALNGI
jgi:hypothetical protein